MKTKILSFCGLMLMILLSVAVISCQKGNMGAAGGGGAKVKPADANGLTAVLVVPGSSVTPGNMPTPTSSSGSPTLSMIDTTVSYSAGGQVKLPIQFSSGSGQPICGVYFQVNGAGSYFDIPISPTTFGTLVLPITIPSNVASGKFCITISLYNCNTPHQISNTFETCITVTQPVGCNSQTEAGGEGITSTLYNMSQTAGYVNIDYDTYTVPDRIDIFYNDIWVAGTGSAPTGPGGTVPPLANCSNPTDGYVGATGTFCFHYDPATMGKKIEVVVSGCVRGGTAWKYTIHCPTATGSCLVGNDGNPRFNLKFTNESQVDLDLYVKDPSGEIISYSNPSSVSGGSLDVDCKCSSCSMGPNENIAWPTSNGPSGQYEYWVNYYANCSSPGASSSFILTVSNNGSIVATQTGSLNSNGNSPHYMYTK